MDYTAHGIEHLHTHIRIKVKIRLMSMFEGVFKLTLSLTRMGACTP